MFAQLVTTEGLRKSLLNRVESLRRVCALFLYCFYSLVSVSNVGREGYELVVQ